MLAGGGCFRPKILSGGFKCDTTPGAKACPDDFVCVSGMCVTPAHDGGTDGPKGGSGGGAGSGGKGGTGGGGGEKVDAHPDMQPDAPCIPAVAGCTPSDAGICDPVCNVGCEDCHTKCNVSTGRLTCNQPYPGKMATTQTVCTLETLGAAGTTDNCAPGNTCISAECGNDCFQFCRVNSDCNNANCSRDAGGGYKVCDVPFNDTCDPITGAVTGCPFSAQGCYLSTNTARTLCDCPFNADQQGGVSAGLPCTHSRQCLTGLACYDVMGRGSPVCVAVCRLPGDAGTPKPGERVCPGGANTCLPFLMGGPNYGYCST